VTSIRSSYKLKRFLSTADADFAAALMLYVRNTPHAIRTNSNEISSWLDNTPSSFGGTFYVFGFYRDRKLIGYSEASYFPAEQLLVFDYITIDEGQRGNHVFFEFVDHLRRYLEGLHPEYRYAVAEVAYGSGEQQPSQDSRLLTRLLKLQGFHVIRAQYFQPRLAINDAESEMPADLLILSTSASERIQVDTYLRIVRTIYFEYYLPWYTGTPEVTKTYHKHLDRLYSRIQASVKRKQYIVVNGHKSILHPPAVDSISNTHRPVLVFAVQSLGLVGVLFAILLSLRAAFHLTDNSLVAIYLLALLSFLAVAGVVSKEARLIFTHTLGAVKTFFGKSSFDSTPSEPEQAQIATHDLDEL